MGAKRGECSVSTGKVISALRLFPPSSCSCIRLPYCRQITGDPIEDEDVRSTEVSKRRHPGVQEYHTMLTTTNRVPHPLLSCFSRRKYRGENNPSHLKSISRIGIGIGIGLNYCLLTPPTLKIWLSLRLGMISSPNDKRDEDALYPR